MSTLIKRNDSSSSTSSDESSSSDETDFRTRTKRSLDNKPTYFSKYYVSKIIWPPKTSNWRKNLKPVNFGRHNTIKLTTSTTIAPCDSFNSSTATITTGTSQKMQLYCRTNYFLGVYPDGTIRGTLDESDLHTFLELTSTEYVGHVRIKGLLSNCYVAMNAKGRIYAEPLNENENTIFIESMEAQHNTYLSQQYAFKGWYLALNKKGKPKNGKRTKPRQKGTHFLPRRKRFE